MRTLAAVALLLLLVAPADAQMPDPPGQVKAGEAAKNPAYLFAHMTKADYGRLYYSVSLDGLHWTLLNGGKRILDDYRGHPDVCRGPDGRYYLVGNPAGDKPVIHFWVSDDLLSWTPFGDYAPPLDQAVDYPKALPNVGAPKLYFDEPSGKFLLTWHTPHDLGKTDLPEPYWASQRTLYVTSADLKTFDGPPRKLFDFDLGTIDTIVRRVGGRYYAVFKDERYPTPEWPTGKTVRVTSGKTMTGPWRRPGPPISPNFCEAPTLVPSPDGRAWYCYFEEYPGVRYGLSVALELDGPWYGLFGDGRERDWDKFELPRGASVRHGSMRVITRAEYDALVKAFPPAEEPSDEPRHDVP